MYNLSLETEVTRKFLDDFYLMFPFDALRRNDISGEFGRAMVLTLTLVESKRA